MEDVKKPYGLSKEDIDKNKFLNAGAIEGIEAATAGIDFDKYLIDLTEDVPEPPPLVSISEIPIFTRGNVSSITGKAKSRKTFLNTLLSQRFLSMNDKCKIIIFDTEMAKFHTQKTVRRIHRLMDWDERTNEYDRLKVFHLRELSTKERLEFIQKAIPLFTPDLVFIDGVKDICSDFNNLSESGDLVNILMRLSSVHNCHICSIIHLNKVDNNARGHLGTELMNKSETVINVTADGDTSSASPEYCRNLPFEKFWFRINENGLPEYCNPELKPKSNDKLKKLFEEVFEKDGCLSYSDLVSMIMDKIKISESTAKRRIKIAIDESIIIKNSEGDYYFVSYSNTDNELPFENNATDVL